jgi:anti-sigma regulatory factor (Ser/Thr protein kinase)
MSAERQWSSFADRDGATRRRFGDRSGVKGLTVVLDRGPQAAGAARHALEAVEDQLDPEVRDDLRLLVSELVTNSVRHVTHDRHGTVALRLKLEPETVRVEVTDAGDGFEPAPRTDGQSQASGWGLYLVDRMTDRWGVIRDDMTRVWFEIDGAAMPVAA